MQAALVEFDAMRRSPDWARWRELAADAPPFLGPECFALVRPLVHGGTALVAQARSASRMHGVLPLLLGDHTLRAMGSTHSPGYDFCGDDEAIASIWDCLRDDHRWDELVLGKVPASSLLATRLPAMANCDGCPTTVRPVPGHPFFALTGFEARLAPKFRTNLQRCARKADDLQLERIAVPTSTDLDDATAIEAMAWKGAAGTNIAADARVDHVYRVLARMLGRRGRSALYFLRIHGRRIAMLFAVEDHHTLYALKIGFDPHYANLSPGHLLVWHVARDAENRGLLELNFVGREDEWKRKWTDLVHEHVAITIYRRSARGLIRYTLREVIRPRLPEPARTTPCSPLPRRCQRSDIIGDHTMFATVAGRLHRGLGIRSGLRRILAKRTKPSAPLAVLGEPSGFPVGSWVRVRSAEEIRASLDSRGRARGLAFVPTQLPTCGGVYRVQRHVRRIRDDRGRLRAVSRTVLLESVDCGGPGPEPAGCGRHCPLMFRDEWLEATQAPRREPPPASTQRHARIRDSSEIFATLDLFGRRDGLTFMPEMEAYVGRRLPIVGRVTKVFEHDRWIETASPVYILGGAQCSGAIMGESGPCDRACALLWHEDWLIVEPELSP